VTDVGDKGKFLFCTDVDRGGDAGAAVDMKIKCADKYKYKLN